jgi:RNA polymerase sigma factor (sigma-70 family)
VKQQASQSVYVVDDDDAVRDSLLELLGSVGVEAKGFSSAQKFLEDFETAMNGCLVLDIRMPGMSGLELQQKLAERGSILPVIFITGHGDVPMAVEAMKRGATEFIQKPFRDQELLDCIHSALESSREKHKRQDEKRQVQKRLDTLTEREKEVLDRIVSGQANKVIAIELDISQRTVENHRARILEKMQARSTTALVKLMILANHEVMFDTIKET